ncbi:MAG: S1C family serine protease [Planctomycetota bacterium]
MSPAIRLLLVSLLLPLSVHGAAVGGVPPPELAAADARRAALYTRYRAAVVGLDCRGRLGGRMVDYYGTGVVVDPDGLVLSNITVVPADASKLRIHFTSGHVRPGRIVRVDRSSEAVLLQVDAPVTDLVHMPLAASDATRPGDVAYSWGNPFFTIQRDGGVSLSRGVISGAYTLDSVDDQSRYAGPVLETDAAVNPGSDGGPLTDAEGRLLGVMSLAFSPTRWLGCAIPVHRMRMGIPELAELNVSLPQSGDDPLDAALRRAAARCAPAVVCVWTHRSGDPVPTPSTLDRPPPELEPYLRGSHAERERRSPPIGAASGFLVDPAGLVVTAAHNVADRDDGGTVEAIHVFTADGSRHPATLLGSDTARDIAVLDIGRGSDDWPHLALPGGATPPVGSAVAVLGRSEPPGGMTLNRGAVGATTRLQGLALQISARINYGNLGGPVIDHQGRLVGLASHLSPETVWRQNCGVGFCLTVERLATAVDRLRLGESLPPLARPFIGVVIDPFAQVAGARIDKVGEDGPAERAGLQAGDRIVRWADETIDDFIALRRAIRGSRPGQTVMLGVVRNDEGLDLELQVGSR